MNFKSHQFLFLWVLALLVMGCNTTPPKQEITCDTLRQPELQAFIRTDPTQAQFAEWVSMAYDTNDIAVEASSTYEEVMWITWEVAGRTHQATFNDEALQYVNVRLDTTSATIASTIDCLGEPPLYSARMFSGFEGRQVEVGLWYPEQGIEIGFAPDGRQAERVQLRTTYPAFAINYLPTNTLDEGFNTLYRLLFDDTKAEWYALIKPYPDDIESVEVTIEP